MEMKTWSLCPKLPARHPTSSLSWSKFLIQTETTYALENSIAARIFFIYFSNKILMIQRQSTFKMHNPV